MKVQNVQSFELEIKNQTVSLVLIWLSSSNSFCISTVIQIEFCNDTTAYHTRNMICLVTLKPYFSFVMKMTHSNL